MEKVQITVVSEGKPQKTITARLPLELGRQSTDDSGLYRVQPIGGYQRIAIAPITNVAVPRKYLHLSSVGGQHLRAVNIHGRTRFTVAGPVNEIVEPGEATELAGESVLLLANELQVHVRLINAPDSSVHNPESSGYRTLVAVDEPDAANLATQAKIGELIREKNESQQGKVAVQLVRQSLDVLKKAAGSDEYFDAAVRNVAIMVELDRAYVILHDGQQWKTRAKFSAESDTAELYSDSGEIEQIPTGSSSLLQRVLETQKTIIYEPNVQSSLTGSSMMNLDRAVAAPMVEDGTVIGVLYGDRSFSGEHSNEPIGELEATLLEVMASAVAAGLARQKEEMMRSSLTQFFSPAVTSRLEREEDLLSGRDAEVTVLFCDVRGFSAIAERVGPQRTIEWINDVLTELSECVIRTDGVLVDYIGDELMAMWGAPAEQPDHAVRACQAALDMLDRVEPLRQRHQEITPDHFGIGIGINSGAARVGNTGSRVKFKYGPLGNTVNVASRVQGMTKKFGVPILITESTQQLLDVLSDSQSDCALAHRRIADAQPLGVNEVVKLYQLDRGIDQAWLELRERYERALQYYQQADLTDAARELASLVHDHANDAPSMLLLGRVVNTLTRPEADHETVFKFETK